MVIMNEGCKIKQLKENLKIKNKLNRLWIYKIDYFITIESPTDVIFTLAIKKDQNIITGSDVNGDGITDYYTQLSGTIINQLLPEEVITLILKASKTVNISFNSSTNAKMSIIKLS